MGCKVKELRFGLHKCRTPDKLPENSHNLRKHIFYFRVAVV